MVIISHTSPLAAMFLAGRGELAMRRKAPKENDLEKSFYTLALANADHPNLGSSPYPIQWLPPSSPSTSMAFSISRTVLKLIQHLYVVRNQVRFGQ